MTQALHIVWLGRRHVLMEWGLAGRKMQEAVNKLLRPRCDHECRCLLLLTALQKKMVSFFLVTILN